MNERTVQVPASLIKRTTAVCERLTAHITDQRDVDAVSDLRALLSQPTPTAEQITSICPRCGGSGSNPVPLRIESAPLGTTFVGRTWGQIDDELWFRTALGVTSATGVRAEMHHIDPSTIRDVTPPAVTE